MPYHMWDQKKLQLTLNPKKKPIHIEKVLLHLQEFHRYATEVERTIRFQGLRANPQSKVTTWRLQVRITDSHYHELLDILSGLSLWQLGAASMKAHNQSMSSLGQHIKPDGQWQPMERWWQGFFREGEEQAAFQGHLRTLYFQLVLLNVTSTYCYANATWMALLWTLLSLKPPLLWGPRAANLAALLKSRTGIQLETFAPFQDLFESWGAHWDQDTADSAEYLVWVLQWLDLSHRCVDHRWERRIWEKNCIRVEDQGDTHTPILLDFEMFAQAHDVELHTLLLLWHQEHGGVKALTGDTQCVNLQLARWRKDDDNVIHKIHTKVNEIGRAHV